MIITNNIIVALDGMSFNHSQKLISRVRNNIYGIKINHMLLPYLQDYVKDGLKVFVDLKLHDIPNTIETVLEWLIKQKADMATIHLANGPACFKQIAHLNVEIKLLIVSHLTSFPQQEVWQRNTYKEICESKLAAHGMILSPQDLKMFNDYDPSHLYKRVCPGIRMHNRNDDQVRTGTPYEAISNGADYLVVGRPITAPEVAFPEQAILGMYRSYPNNLLDQGVAI